MKQELEFLRNGGVFDTAQALTAMRFLLENDVSAEQIKEFLTFYKSRVISLNELCGFRQALLDLATPIDLAVDLEQAQLLDVCGTGGDGKDTFNISTLSAFVIAGTGIKVAKHGNYSASSSFGSSNLLELLGIKLHCEKDLLKQDLDRAGICFLHAPYFHPALKKLSPIRKELGFRTIFNLVGPLVNPARPKFQYIGVSSSETFTLFSELLKKEALSYKIIYSEDGYDEISLTGSWREATRDSETRFIPKLKVSPEQILSLNDPDKIKADALAILQNIASPSRIEVVLANAAAAIMLAKPEISREESVSLARESIESGRAFKVLQKVL